MDFDELENNLDKLMSLQSLKDDPEAALIVDKIRSSINSEKHFAFESESSQPTLTLNKAGYIVKASDAAVRVMAFDKENLCKTNFLNLIHPDNKSQVIESLPDDSHPSLVECPVKIHNDYKWFQIMFINSPKEDNFGYLLPTSMNSNFLSQIINTRVTLSLKLLSTFQ